MIGKVRTSISILILLFLTQAVTHAETTPAIDYFTSSMTSITDLQVEGDIIIPVSWSVSNRPINTNLIFIQQVGSDVQNVELPRDFVIVASQGDGWLDPVMPPPIPAIQGSNAIDFQVQPYQDNWLPANLVFEIRLVDLSTDEILAYQLLEIPLILTGDAASEITSFTASSLNPQTVVFNWDIAGDFSSAEIIWGGSDHYPGDRVIAIPLTESNGSLSYDMPSDIMPGDVTFTLQLLYSEVTSTITLSCPYEWGWNIESPYSSLPCPATDVLSMPGAYQPFENGFMVWDGDSIVVFYDNGTSAMHADNWNGIDYAIEGTPGNGLYEPINGFGYLWNTNPTIRTQLGWATSPEQAYTINTQRTASYNTYPYPVYYMTLPNGDLVQYDAMPPGPKWTFAN